MESIYSNRMLQGQTDEQLVSLYHSMPDGAEREAVLDALFSRHYQKVSLWCLRFAGNRDEASDLAQDVFVNAYRHLESFRGDAKFATWLFSICRFHCLNALKSKSRRATDELDDSHTDPTTVDPLKVLQQESDARFVHRLLNDTLDETERKVVTLHYGEEMTLGSITRLLGLTNQSGAKAYIVSARRKLDKAIQRLKR